MIKFQEFLDFIATQSDNLKKKKKKTLFHACELKSRHSAELFFFNFFQVPATASSDDDERKRLLQEEMEKFKAEMAQKREARQEAIKALNSRVSALEIEKEAAIAENIRLKEELEEVKNGAGLEALKLKLFEERRQEDENDFDDDESSKDEIIDGLNRQVKALKDVAKIGGEMMKIRELQVSSFCWRFETNLVFAKCASILIKEL